MAFMLGFVSSFKYFSTFLTGKESSHMIDILLIRFIFFKRKSKHFLSKKQYNDLMTLQMGIEGKEKLSLICTPFSSTHN